jgi:hypothetical protein
MRQREKFNSAAQGTEVFFFFFDRNETACAQHEQAARVTWRRFDRSSVTQRHADWLSPSSAPHLGQGGGEEAGLPFAGEPLDQLADLLIKAHLKEPVDGDNTCVSVPCFPSDRLATTTITKQNKNNNNETTTTTKTTTDNRKWKRATGNRRLQGQHRQEKTQKTWEENNRKQAIATGAQTKKHMRANDNREQKFATGADTKKMRATSNSEHDFANEDGHDNNRKQEFARKADTHRSASSKTTYCTVDSCSSISTTWPHVRGKEMVKRRKER